MITHIQQHMRFKPNPLETAMIDMSASTPAFKPTHSAIIVNESFSGSALVLSSEFDIPVNSIMRVQVGKMDALRAEVVWFKRLDAEVVKIGINFLE